MFTYISSVASAFNWCTDVVVAGFGERKTSAVQWNAQNELVFWRAIAQPIVDGPFYVESRRLE